MTIAARRERVVLATLLLHANGSVPTSTLIDAVWGARVPGTVHNQLQRCIHQLRRRLDSAGLNEVIVTGPAAYRAVVSPDQLDLLEFRHFVAQARAADRPAEAVAAYRSALRLWRGPPLADVESDLIRQAAVALEEERTRVLDERFEAEFAAGGGGELIAELAELVRQFPYRERLHGALMRALYRAGRQADALATYQEARRLLREDLGAEPGPELQRLHRAILARDPSLEAAQSPEAASVRVVPRELPAEAAGFTGRADVLKTLDELLPVGTSPTGPVVISAIAGSGGVGKTALAVHWGHRVGDRFPDGQLYLNLRGYAAQAPLRPIDALTALLRSLGLPPDQVPPDETEASARYRSLLAGRRVLVILDNARSVEQVRPLLPGAPGCLVLVTSRDRLAGLVARDGARRLTLDVLAPDEAYELLIRLLGADRVAAELESARELATVCAHLPLALRIAAALLEEHPDRGIGELVTELSGGRRLAALAVPDDDQTAVRATFDLSYRAIAEPARRLFRLLGLVPGPDVTQPTAAALADLPEPEAQHLLDRLTTAHLLNEHAPGRYTFHDLLREFARDRARHDDSEADRKTALTRLFRWYLGLADAACRLIRPTSVRLPMPPDEPPNTTPLADRAEAIRLLDTERANLVAAVEHAASHGPRRYAWLIADRLRPYLMRCMGADGLSIGHASVSSAQADGGWHEQAAAHLSLADAGRLTGDLRLAQDHYLLASTLGERGGWVEGQAAAENNMAIIHIEAGRLKKGAARLEKALAINQRLQRLASQASNLGNLGVIMCELGDLRGARDRWKQCLAIHADMGDHNGVALGHANLGRACWLLGDLREAHEQLDLALRLLAETGDRSGRIYALRILAAVLCDDGRPTEALRRAEVAVSLVPDTLDRYETSCVFTSAGTALRRLGRREEAARHYEKALTAGQGQQYATACALIGLGMTQHDQGGARAAEESVQRALGIARAVGYRVIEGQALTALADIMLGRHRFEEATHLAEEALRSHRTTGHRLGEARTLTTLAQIRRDRVRVA